MNKPSRRDFLKTTAVTGVGFWVAAGVAAKASSSPNEKLGVAGIGVGGKGSSDIANAAKWGNIVGICDVDRGRLANAGKNYESAQAFVDFREMLEKLDKQIDVVTVSTPDHMHAPAALMAMRMKKHMYVQKPLTRSIYEARKMGEVAKEMGVCTQMGNQGSASDSTREAIAQVKAGMVGTVKDVHVWTNRPVWPQGLDVVAETMETYAEKAKKEDPDLADELIAEKKKEIEDKLAVLDWELWIGAGKYRDFYPGLYHDFAWRGWWDFGSGALGDMACHTFNMPFYACDLKNPTSVQAISSGHNFDSFPQRSKIFFEFPATSDRPALTATWYDGGNKPGQEIFDELGLTDTKASGALIIGDKGALYTDDDYCGSWRPVKCEKIEGVKFTSTPHPSGGNIDAAQSAELYEAIMKNDPSICSGEYSKFGGPLTETILLGNLAVWAASGVEEMGEKIEWDAVNLKVTNNVKTKGVVELIKPQYRSGYRLD